MLSNTFHDDKVVSIAVTDDTLVIKISAPGKITTIEFNGLEKLRITDFKEGNIINAAQVFKFDHSPHSESTARSLLKYAYELDDINLGRSAKLSSFLDKRLKEYQEGSIVILEIEPSYGAYIVAVGKETLEKSTPI